MTSVVIIAIGMALMAVSLATRYPDTLELVTWISGWLGVLLVIGGVGKLFFLDER